MNIRRNINNFYAMSDIFHYKMNDNNDMAGIDLLFFLFNFNFKFLCVYNGHCGECDIVILYLVDFFILFIYGHVNNAMECIMKWFLFEVCYGCIRWSFFVFILCIFLSCFDFLKLFYPFGNDIDESKKKWSFFVFVLFLFFGLKFWNCGLWLWVFSKWLKIQINHQHFLRLFVFGAPFGRLRR